MGSTVAVALILFLAAVPAVLAVTFQVGDTAGWNSGVDYTSWVSGKIFRVGDTLEFQYGPSHSVAVVDKAGFDGSLVETLRLILQQSELYTSFALVLVIDSVA